MVATLTASYFLLTADYGPEPNVLDPRNRDGNVGSRLHVVVGVRTEEERGGGRVGNGLCKEYMCPRNVEWSSISE
ncbi:hypothetical protein AgCh_019150 [Apium graveolens]